MNTREFIQKKITKRRAAKRLKAFINFLSTPEYKNCTADQREAVHTMLRFYAEIVDDKKGANS